ncbi:hypothetical protein MKW98_028348 [Papaver atlanticum]|uniref:Cystatin domain-containing protein n=1 Tax=Papaver atlanticum TaxID=357466 RepID=A0AAD4SW31_9MAGN|nr:hypothetical protein MKW98_028348 [Papaver atlanticum]
MAALFLTFCILSSSFLAISIFLFIRFFSPYSPVNGLEELDGNVVSGGRREIYFLFFNIQVHELGKYAVAEYNLKFKKGEKRTLVFKKVVEAHDQFVAGTNYFLKISAIQNGKPQLFDDFVHVNLNGENRLVRLDPSFD